MRFTSSSACLAALICMAGLAFGQPAYDLLLQGGHVIDAKNNISAVRDVAIKDGKIAAVAAHLDPAAALKVVNVAGLYVTPGLIDIHAHVYAGTGERGSYAGDLSLYPGRLHLPRRRDHGGGCRLRRLAQLRRFQGPHHRSLQDARAGVPQYRGQRHARRQIRERSERHGSRARGRDGAAATRT